MAYKPQESFMTESNFSGRVQREYRDSKGRLHRDDGPAFEVTFIGMNFGEERWYRKGKMHREDGPAIILRYKSGEVSQTWANYGKTSTEEEWFRHLSKKKKREAIWKRGTDAG